MNIVWSIITTPIGNYPVIAAIVLSIVFYILGRIVWALRVYVIRYKYILKRRQGWITLEIRIPREIERSPEAMELFLINAMYQSGGIGSWYKKYWQGKILNWSSLEIVSFGGSVHFYIRCHKWMKDIVEAQLYAQFPQIEILDVADYTDRIPPFDKDADWNLYGGTFKYEEDTVLPIRTYKDWGVDRHTESLDSEQQIDPINAIYEALSSLREGEEMWIQILLQANKGSWWKKRAEKYIQALRDKYEIGEKKTEEEGGGDRYRKLTKGQEEQINAIERSMEKFRFETGIRVIYLAKKDKYDGSKHIYIKNLFSGYASQHLNRLKRVTLTGFDHPWQDFNGFLDNRKKKRFLEDYRNCEYFHLVNRINWFDLYMKYIDDYDQPELVMTTEEIASLWHFPSRSLQTPGVERIESRKSEPPSNLPT